jgi:hypothetical protein
VGKARTDDGPARAVATRRPYGDVYFPFDGSLQGARDLASVAVERRPEGGHRIVERYSLDGNGIVDVLIRDEDSGYEQTYRLGKA